MTSILVTGTISPWLWSDNLSVFYQGQLIDPGYFGGGLLTGDPIQVIWDSVQSTANVTINEHTVTFGPTALSFTMWDNSQSITVSLSPYIALTNYSPELALHNINGIGGGLHLLGLDGYYYVNSMVPVPAPLAGSVPSVIILCILCRFLLTTLARYVKMPNMVPVWSHITGSTKEVYHAGNR